jgi:hypothetical protein
MLKIESKGPVFGPPCRGDVARLALTVEGWHPSAIGRQHPLEGGVPAGTAGPLLQELDTEGFTTPPNNLALPTPRVIRYQRQSKLAVDVGSSVDDYHCAVLRDIDD